MTSAAAFAHQVLLPIGMPMLRGLERSQLVGVSGDGVGEAAHESSPVGRRDRAPSRTGVRGALDRGIGVGA